jgi:4-hydroxy-tetrahydrodipicolinate synthase
MPKLDASAQGVYLITVTPFRDDGALDLESTDRVTDFYLDKGATGLTVLGVMGEAPKLTTEESRRYVKRVLDRVAGRVPVIVGVSSPGFAAMGELARSVMDLGAAGVMVGPAATVRTDDQAYNHFELAAETLGPATPFCVQDHPLAFGVQLPAGVLVRIFKALPTAVMLKHEDWPGPGLAKLAAMRAESDRGSMRRIAILAGNGGGLFLPEELERGADGAMTGFGYPEMMVGVCAAHAAGERERARDIFDAYLPLARYEQQAALGLAVRKYLLAKRGAIASAALRKPGPKLSAADIADIERLVERQRRRLEEIA